MKTALYYSVEVREVPLRSVVEVYSHDNIGEFEKVRGTPDMLGTRTLSRTEVPIDRWCNVEHDGSITTVYAAIDQKLFALLKCSKKDFEVNESKRNAEHQACLLECKRELASVKVLRNELKALTLWGRIKWAFSPFYGELSA